MSNTKKKKEAKPSITMEETKAPLKPVDPLEDASKHEAEKALADIRSQAELKSSAMLTEEPEFLGKSPETTASTDRAQADALPGTLRPDPTYLPEHAYDEGSLVSRRVTLPNEYHYIWVVDVKVTQFRALGYKFCIHDGGPQSGLAEGGFRGTGLYERTLDNHIRNGDTFLMYAPLRLYEQMQQRDRDQIEAWTVAAQRDLHNEGYKRGVRTFEEVDGQIIYN
jgi:hypothetical protein